MSTLERIRDIVVREVAWPGDPALLTPEFGLIDNEVIDSLGILELVQHIEASFGVEVGDDDLVPDNFETLTTIAAMVDGKIRS